MKGRDGRRGGGQREGGQGRVHCLLHKTQQCPRTFFRLKCPFQGCISDSNLANSRQILLKLMGTQSSRSGLMTAGEEEGLKTIRKSLQFVIAIHKTIFFLASNQK